MAEIIETSKESTPAMRFIGKKYGDEDRVDGWFGAKWDEWFENGWFDTLEQLGSPTKCLDNAIGLMGHENGNFKYWIGRFAPAGTPVPEGFDYIDYDAGHMAFCRLKGQEDSIWGKEPMCCDHLQAMGEKMLDKEFICFERYPHCDNADVIKATEEGLAIIDICFFVE